MPPPDGPSVAAAGIEYSTIALRQMRSGPEQLGALAEELFKTLDHDEASDFASEEGVKELGIIAE